MKKTIAPCLLFFGASLVVFFAIEALSFSDQEEKEVVLLEGSKVQPAFAVMVGNAVYFSQANNLDGQTSDPCLAHDIYKIDFQQKTESLVLRVDCVTGLSSDGTSLYFYYLDKQSQKKVKGYRQNKIVDAIPEDVIKFSDSRLMFELSMLGLRGNIPKKQAIGITTKYWVLITVLGAEKSGFFIDSFERSSSRAVKKRLVFHEFPIKVRLEALQRIAVSGLNFVSFVFKESGIMGMGSILRYEMEQNSWEVFGGKSPLPRGWKESAQDGWSIREPRYFVDVGNGFVVADRTSFLLSEDQGVSYFQQKNGFKRVGVPDKDVGGISVASGGLILSRPWEGKIVWYGKNSEDFIRKVESGNE